MYKIRDLLELHQYRSTYYNFFKVFEHDWDQYFVGDPNAFKLNQEIHTELYLFFQNNNDFFKAFYTDWHTKKTIQQLSIEAGLPINKIIKFFNDKKIVANRNMPIVSDISIKGKTTIKIDTPFRYYSRYQLIEKIHNTKCIARPLNIKLKNKI